MPSETLIERGCELNQTLVSYHLGSLDHHALGEVEEHLRGCRRCRMKLIALEIASAINDAEEATCAGDSSDSP